jgi:hypothetical protein
VSITNSPGLGGGKDDDGSNSFRSFKGINLFKVESGFK